MVPRDLDTSVCMKESIVWTSTLIMWPTGLTDVGDTLVLMMPRCQLLPFMSLRCTIDRLSRATNATSSLVERCDKIARDLSLRVL